MITVKDYFTAQDGTRRDQVYASELTEVIKANAVVTVERANKLLAAFGESRKLTSGWRPQAVNSRVLNAAATSKHLSGQAVDIADPEGDLDEWCLVNKPVLESLQLWLEHPSATKGWCHVQTIPPKSGNRVFYP